MGSGVPCFEYLEREILIETPDVCSLDAALMVSDATSTDDEFIVYGVSAGVCRIHVGLAGTDFFEDVMVTVVDPT